MNNWEDQVIGWWGGERVRTAFLIAPLGFPAVMLIVMMLSDLPGGAPAKFLMAFLVGLYSLPLSYIGTLLVGVPTYRFLCARNLTAFWVAPAAGFIAGAVLSIIIFWLVTLVFGPVLFGYEDTTGIARVSRLVLSGGLPGAINGTIVWLIARPDRQNLLAK